MLTRWTAGREPALLATLLGVAIKLLGVWVGITDNQQSALNAIVAAGLGVLTAYAVKDGQSAAILGFAQAGIALVIGFGLGIDGETQGLIMSAVAIAVGMYERTQVTAPIGPPH